VVGAAGGPSQQVRTTDSRQVHYLLISSLDLLLHLIPSNFL
jgi:hypothetical protein